MNKILINTILILTLLIFYKSSYSQSLEETKDVLKGTWVKVESDSDRDTLMFYFDGFGCDFAIKSTQQKLNHGYFIKILQDSLLITGMCSDEEYVIPYKITSDKELEIKDFYRNSNDFFKFNKISPKVW